jgi:hypothetical protein
LDVFFTRPFYKALLKLWVTFCKIWTDINKHMQRFLFSILFVLYNYVYYKLGVSFNSGVKTRMDKNNFFL